MTDVEIYALGIGTGIFLTCFALYYALWLARRLK